jgi:hypothetical protein
MPHVAGLGLAIEFLSLEMRPRVAMAARITL